MASNNNIYESLSDEQIIALLQMLFTNMNNLDRLYYDMFINTTPLTLTLERYNEDGVLESYKLPNRAKDRSNIIQGRGTPEKSQIAIAGSIYLDTLTSNIDDDDNSKAAAVGYIAYVLYIICQYIILWLSRTREYYADSFSTEKLKNPNILASALVKIGYGLSATSTRVAKHSVAAKNALGIFDSRTSKSLIVTSYNNGEVSKENIKNAMKWEMWNIWAKWYELNSTHPLISRRLLALSNLSKQYGLEPYIEFDLKREESFVDDFIVELIIKYLPLLAVFVSLGLFIFFEINMCRFIFTI